MRNYDRDEPHDVGIARRKFSHPLDLLTFNYNGKRSFIDGQLLHRPDLPISKRQDYEDQLLYMFCEATHTYCALMSDLREYETLPKETHRWMKMSVEEVATQAKEMLKLMEKVQEQYQPDGNWCSDFIDFGKWLYNNDQSTSMNDMMINAMQSINCAMEDIKRKEEMDVNGEKMDPKEFGEICQRFGQGKVMIESCLLPAVILRQDTKAANILTAAKREVVDPFIVKHNLESHLTPKGFLFSQTRGLDKLKDKNYFAKPFEVIKSLTNQRGGTKLYQREGSFGTKCEFARDVGKGKLTIRGDLTKSIKTQYNPNAPEIAQQFQKAVSTFGSAVSAAKIVESVAKGGVVGIAKEIFDSISITYDENKNVIGDEKSGKPSEITNIIPNKAKDEQSSIEHTDAAVQVDDKSKDGREYFDVLVELSKMIIKDSDIEISQVEIGEYLDFAEKLSTVGNAAISISANNLENLRVTSAFSALTELLYEYQDIDKLPRVDVEVNKLASLERENIRLVAETAVRCYNEERAKEDAWLKSPDGQSYLREVERRNAVLERAGYEIEQEQEWTPKR